MTTPRITPQEDLIQNLREFIDAVNEYKTKDPEGYSKMDLTIFQKRDGKTRYDEEVQNCLTRIQACINTLSNAETRPSRATILLDSIKDSVAKLKEDVDLFVKGPAANKKQLCDTLLEQLGTLSQQVGGKENDSPERPTIK